MTSIKKRAAVFLDFENLYSTLKNGLEQGRGDYGQSPSIDFGHFVEHINEKYGQLDNSDFIVAANFSHYNQQLGGLNRLAKVVGVDSFEPRQARNLAQSSPGKKHVIENYSDMALAFLAGAHVARTPADAYFFVTGDKAFAAVATMIQDVYQKQVAFIFPNPASAGMALVEGFTWYDFKDTQPSLTIGTNETEIGGMQTEPKPVDPFLELRGHISNLRREFCSAIPISLVKALMVTENPQKLIDQARTNGVLDIWQTPDGVTCVSLQEERMVGKVVPIDLRPYLDVLGLLLLNIKEIGGEQQKVLSRADWRTKIRENSQFSNSEAKKLVDLLFSTAILRDGSTNKPALKPERAFTFINQAMDHIMLPW
jgi:hypothetical protein